MKSIRNYYYQFVLVLLLLVVSVEFATAETIFCHSLFKSQIDTNIVCAGCVYSPFIQGHSDVKIASGQILHEYADVNSGKLNQSLRFQQRHDPFGDIGFVHTPSYVETAMLYHQFDRGLEGFIKGFAKRALPEELLAIRHSDANMFQHFIDSHRLGYAGVSPKGQSVNAPFSAFIRVYDATDYSRLPGFAGGKPYSEYGYMGPTEISLAKNEIKTDVFENLRNKGYQIFQIGKYVYDENMTPDQKKSAKKVILQWLLRNYLNPEKMISDQVMFVINVDSLAHETLYRKEFGTQKVDPSLFSPPLAATDGILLVDLTTLRERINKLIDEIN